MSIALQLAKSGWWGGDPGRILKAPADEVMGAAQYSQFTAVYDRTVMELNKPK